MINTNKNKVSRRKIRIEMLTLQFCGGGDPKQAERPFSESYDVTHASAVEGLVSESLDAPSAVF
jgi:hypothetical protein